jgi:hypothetical protein
VERGETLWVVEVIQPTSNSGTIFSTLNDSYNVFGIAIAQQQSFVAVCGSCSREQSRESQMFYFTKSADNSYVYEFTFGEKCQYSRNKITGNKGRFESTTAWLYFDFNIRTRNDSVNQTDVP